MRGPIQQRLTAQGTGDVAGFADRGLGGFSVVSAQEMPMPMPKTASVQSDAQKAFEKLKTLAGSWDGSIIGLSTHMTIRVTSSGNAILHEATGPGRADNPITMFYVDGDRLLLTHYCDAGNRPRMAAKVSPDGKIVEFDFVDLAGSTQYGHMHHVVFTIIDANRHIEDWTYMMPGDKPVRVHMDLQRTKTGSAGAGN